MDIQALLGDEAESLLTYDAKGIPKEDLHLPGPDFVDRIFAQSDRNPQVLRNLNLLFNSCRLARRAEGRMPGVIQPPFRPPRLHRHRVHPAAFAR